MGEPRTCFAPLFEEDRKALAGSTKSCEESQELGSDASSLNVLVGDGDEISHCAHSLGNSASSSDGSSDASSLSRASSCSDSEEEEEVGMRSAIGSYSSSTSKGEFYSMSKSTAAPSTNPSERNSLDAGGGEGGSGAAMPAGFCRGGTMGCKMCLFWQRGRCMMGDNCEFCHHAFPGAASPPAAA